MYVYPSAYTGHIRSELFTKRPPWTALLDQLCGGVIFFFFFWWKSLLCRHITTITGQKGCSGNISPPTKCRSLLEAIPNGIHSITFRIESSFVNRAPHPTHFVVDFDLSIMKIRAMLKPQLGSTSGLLTEVWPSYVQYIWRWYEWVIIRNTLPSSADQAKISAASVLCSIPRSIMYPLTTDLFLELENILASVQQGFEPSSILCPKMAGFVNHDWA